MKTAIVALPHRSPSGYTKPLWDKQTGAIDRDVAEFWRDQGYDLRYYTEENWPTIGRELVGKLHFICGDMDNYYFNLPVYYMEEFLESTSDPYYVGSFRYGRPSKGHGWTPITNAELFQEMARHIVNRVNIATAVAPPKDRGRTYRNVHVFGRGQFDRSPGGTGTCARMAVLHAKGRLAVHEDVWVESVTEGVFCGRILEATTLIGRQAVVPEITGSAHITWLATATYRLLIATASCIDLNF